MKMPEELNEKGLVFHFTKAKAAIESILFSGEIRFSPLNQMNDPYEYKVVSTSVQIRGGGINESAVNQVSSRLRSAILINSKMLCFVERKEDGCDDFERPYTKPRSWAQYGENQYGVCLVFRKNKLLESIRSNIDNISIFEGSVAYNLDATSQPKKNYIKIDKKLSVEDNVKKHIETQKEDIYFRKYRDFKDENEYRIILLDKEQKRPEHIYCPIKGALQAVILGDRFHEVYLELVKGLVAKLDSNTFRLKYGRMVYINKC